MQRGLFDQNLIQELKDAGPIVINKPKVNDLLDSMVDIDDCETDLDKLLKSNKLNISQRLSIISTNVLRVLGKHRHNTVVIKTKQQLHDYVTEAIKRGRIAVDTETNNSLDPVTCLLAGLCLYYPGGKAAYVPINHRDPYTKVRLQWQLTEADIAEELKRIVDAGIFIEMHNGKFDYEVMKCTSGVEVVPDSDTMVNQRIIDENDFSGLKYLYTNKVNPGQAKYDIERLFVGISYLDVDPDIFALYAATDSFETDEVWLYQLPYYFNIKDYAQAKEMFGQGGVPSKDLLRPEMTRNFNLLTNVETKVIKITGDMELTGVCVDQELGARLAIKYKKQLEEVDKEINAQLALVQDKILNWRLSPQANSYPKQYQPKKSKKSRAELEAEYPLVDQSSGKRYRISKKCLKDQLEDPINLSSAAQMAILFYDIFEIEPFDKKTPRATGAEAIETIQGILENKARELGEWVGEGQPSAEDIAYLAKQSAPYKAMAKLCDLLLNRRGAVKLISTYIETIPTLVKHWPDGRIRFHLNSLGTDTGRYSSGGKLKFMENEEAIEVSGINIQNIPSHVKEIRLLFKAECKEEEQELVDNSIELEEYLEIETPNGWKYPRDLKINDIIITDEGNALIKSIIFNDSKKTYRIEVQ